MMQKYVWIAETNCTIISGSEERNDQMIVRDDNWSMIDERAPPLTKLCDPATQIEISYHDRIDDDWSTIDIILADYWSYNLWLSEITRSSMDDIIWFDMTAGSWTEISIVIDKQINGLG